MYFRGLLTFKGPQRTTEESIPGLGIGPSKLGLSFFRGEEGPAADHMPTCPTPDPRAEPRRQVGPVSKRHLGVEEARLFPQIARFSVAKAAQARERGERRR